ncbi:cytochrome P450 [Nonomuraea sp. NN258]|uniref:cytochrome P450 n=1 Tax=Nonomuraea antri TaxID=2730852 RepID=UPI00156A6EF7|nr:cytochrome P450 [Nonomuraea antri]NRQ31771.1 cytochrome P450 [Nonomuraea antri]
MPRGSERVLAARTLSFLNAFMRDPRTPVRAFERVSAEANGEVVRLNMGPFRPYLITHPDHVQHVLKTNQPNYLRAGMFWDPLYPLLGQSILTDGETWSAARKIMQPMFTAKYINTLTEQMSAVLNELIDTRMVAGTPFNVAEGMSVLIHPTMVRLFLGATISDGDIARLVPAYDTGATSRSIRLLLPFVPERFPLPGDRAFRRATRIIDEVVYPRITHAKERDESDGRDLVSLLWQARKGEADADRQVRDDMVSVHAAATETTAIAMAWVWPVLDEHPEIAARVYEEIDRVIGDGPVTIAHLDELTYLRAFIDELVRMYPPGWIIPRRAMTDDVVGGVRIPAGSTVVISPYLSHRLPEFWERPLEFDPERFAPGRERGRHPYAYFPFGGGPHVCLGKYLFLMEAKVIIAGILSKYRPVLHANGPVTPRLASSLRPNHDLAMTLVPAGRR